MSQPETRPRRPVVMLSEDTVRRIAAGEVITRPAAAVKELVENALDAGATDIRIEVRGGGKNLVRIVDNGCGMTRDDARLAVARHATSKLASIDDLRTLGSFGFRGEALASIAAVSKTLIETNSDESGPGTRLEVEGGNIFEIGETARARGTTVSVQTLFFNLPARRSFLKSDSYELRLVAETVKAYALVFPEVGFELTSGERAVFRVAPTSTIPARLRELFDRTVAESFVELRVDNPLLALHCFLTEPTQVKGFYDVQAVFFNRRPVRSRTAVRAVYNAYGPGLGSNNPNFVLLIQTDPARLDVNIHPTKQEVRFADERFLSDFITEAVRKTLGARRAESAGADEFLYQQSQAAGEEAGPQAFWQLHNTYILAQVTSGYVVVDQHAAHERVIYEELVRGRAKAAPQGLLFPITVELSPEQFEALERVGPTLARMGLEAKSFSGRTAVVETVPAGSYMGKDEIRELLAELAAVGKDPAGVEPELAKLVACKAAVKAGQRLSQQEMESLVNRLFACDEPYFCPHGRPAIVKITIEELGRKFGRK